MSAQALRRGRWWWTAAGAYATLVLAVSLLPLKADVGIPHLDKVAHLCEYLLFAWMLMQAVRASRMPEPQYRVWVWIYATSFGLLVELLQAFVPWRSADWLDGLMNALGAACGVWLGDRVPRAKAVPTSPDV